MPGQYTHKFVFQLGDGGKFLEGQVEFDTDNKMSFKFSGISEPLPEETMRSFADFMAEVHKLYDLYGDIKEIKIIKKTV